MKRHLSRKEFLSLGICGGLGLIGISCTLDDIPPDDEDGGWSSAGGRGSTSSTSATTGPTGSGGAASSTTTGSTSGTGGATGSTGSGGAGGKTTGTGGGAGSGGKGGTGGSTGGTGGAGTDGGVSKDGGGDASAMCTAALAADISMNHGHVLNVPLADVMAGAAKTYSIKGTANHDHFVEVTAADFTTLKMGGVVTKHTCNANDHQLTLKCGTPPAAGPQMCASTDNCGQTKTGTTGPCK